MDPSGFFDAVVIRESTEFSIPILTAQGRIYLLKCAMVW